jgi:hypothetical protein
MISIAKGKEHHQIPRKLQTLQNLENLMAEDKEYHQTPRKLQTPS